MINHRDINGDMAPTAIKGTMIVRLCHVPTRQEVSGPVSDSTFGRDTETLFTRLSESVDRWRNRE